MCRLVHCLLCLLLSGPMLLAQQVPLFSQYRDHAAALNPGLLSTDFILRGFTTSVSALDRRQWVSVEGAPQTQLIQGSTILNDDGSVRLLVGGHLMRDRAGAIRTLGAYARVAVLFSPEPDFGGLSVGMTVGAIQYRIRTDLFQARDEGEIRLFSDNQQQMHLDAGIGLMAYRQLEQGFFEDDRVYAGLSVPQIMIFDVEITEEDGGFGVQRVLHPHLMTGWYHMINDETWIEASSWFRYVQNAPLQADFNLRLQWNNRFWIGTGVATTQIVHTEIGVLLSENFQWIRHDLRIGLSADFPFNNLGPAFGPSFALGAVYLYDNSSWY